MTSSRRPPLVPGDVLAGKYRVERVIGAGGMGVVAEAEHLGLGKRVAVKLLRSEAYESPMAAARFLREARAAVQLESEHVAAVFDVGTLEGGAPFIVMELLDGMDLATVCRRTGSLPIEQAVGYVLEACDAIAEAHSLGIVHRDLKPANLFLAHKRDGSAVIKVIDFGISKVSSEVASDASGQTTTGTMIGSPRYMAPEQLRAAKHVDGRADIWSLGVVLYELITGRTPFEGSTVAVVCAQILSSPAPLLRSAQPHASAELERVVERCLDRDPDRRFRDVAELAVSLRPLGPPECGNLVDRIVTMLRPADGAALRAGAAIASNARSSAPRGSAPSARPSVGGGATSAGAQTGSAWGATRADAAPAPKPRARLLAVAVGLLVAAAVGAVVTGLVLRGGPSAGGRPAGTAGEAPSVIHGPVPTHLASAGEDAVGDGTLRDGSDGGPADAAPLVASTTLADAGAAATASSAVTGRRAAAPRPGPRPAGTPAGSRSEGALPDFGGRVY